jgi:hypothetical protein
MAEHKFKVGDKVRIKSQEFIEKDYQYKFYDNRFHITGEDCIVTRVCTFQAGSEIVELNGEHWWKITWVISVDNQPVFKGL